MIDTTFTPEKTEVEKLKEGLKWLPVKRLVKSVPLGNFRDKPEKPIEYLVEGLLAREDLLIFAGKSKAGKSTCLLNLAFSLSSGAAFVGRVCQKCRVLMITLEDKDKTVRNRARKLAEKLGVFPPDQNLEFIFRSEFLEAGDGESIFDKVSNKLLEDKRRAEEGNQLAKWDVVIIDPLYYLADSIEENSSKEMGALVRAVRNLALKVGCTLIVATHSKKGSVADLEAEEATAGSGMVGRIGEAYISLAPHEKENHLIARYKLRDGLTPESEVWKIEDYPLLELATGEDPIAYKKGGGGTGGRPKVYTEEKVLSLFPDLKKEFDTAEIIDMCRKKYNMSQTTAERLLRELRDSGELESVDGKYRRKFTPNENV